MVNAGGVFLGAYIIFFIRASRASELRCRTFTRTSLLSKLREPREKMRNSTKPIRPGFFARKDAKAKLKN